MEWSWCLIKSQQRRWLTVNNARSLLITFNNYLVVNKWAAAWVVTAVWVVAATMGGSLPCSTCVRELSFDWEKWTRWTFESFKISYFRDGILNQRTKAWNLFYHYTCILQYATYVDLILSTELHMRIICSRQLMGTSRCDNSEALRHIGAREEVNVACVLWAWHGSVIWEI